MDERRNESQRPTNPRRRIRSKAQIFKEAYLPVVIAAAALVLIVIFIIGSISRSVQRNQAEEEASIAASIAAAEQEAALAIQEQQLLKQSQVLAESYDYDGAIDLLGTFQGDMSKYPAISGRLDEYLAIKNSLVVWDDPSKVQNLSFQMLIADLQMAKKYEAYSYTINRSFITTGEFSQILQQLYDNGYVLVTMDNFVTMESPVSSDSTRQLHQVRLPADKKPLMLTQTNVNYNYYLIDSDGDKSPDKNSGGFANKLMLTDSGEFTCQMINSNGETVTGAYDLVPILEEFIAQHPDFSYQGARATLALTGYNGLFGYRTQLEDATDDDIFAVRKLANALQVRGYKLACYTYENIPYGTADFSEVKADLNSWKTEVEPIIGNVDTLVYAQQSDIADNNTAYAGERFELLWDNGFRFFLGFCTDGNAWGDDVGKPVRQGRILVSGSSLAHHEDWFTGLFDATVILDSNRSQIPD